MQRGTLEAGVPHTLTKADEGLKRGIVRNTETSWPTMEGAMAYCATPKSLSNIQLQIRKTTDTGRMYGRKNAARTRLCHQPLSRFTASATRSANKVPGMTDKATK